MAKIRSQLQPLSDTWQCAQTEPGSISSPDHLPALDWLPATVPGTFAGTLRAAGVWDGETPLELDHRDIWYRTNFAGGGSETLHFEGLATIAEVWLNGELILRSENMFLPHRLSVVTGTSNELHICFRSLSGWLAAQRGRARWRTRLASPPNLRFARTTLLGRMPGWCPTVHPVGPWRPVLRDTQRPGVAITAADVRTTVDNGNGHVVITVISGLPAYDELVAELDGKSVRLERTAGNVAHGTIVVPDVPLWWPHTHGKPAVFPLTLRSGSTRYPLGSIGFRNIGLEHGDDDGGFSISINDTPVFCRGACWTTADIVSLPGDRQAYLPWLPAVRDAGMNMVRVGGTMVYESDEFYTLCDELGLLVWQDAMLANFDYPDTDAFRGLLGAELRAFLDATQASPSLTVFCGGSEVLQQAAMFGLPRDRIPTALYDSFIPEVVHRLRPDVLYVPNTPQDGPWPFQPDTGVSHYYGVGAYLRPLDDIRRAGVRFASETLALANVPEADTVHTLHVHSVTDPAWKRGVPRDTGAGWDFEDVRDHYLELLFGVNPNQVRWSDLPRYLDLSRAVSCLLAEHLFGEWRRVGSQCGGGLVWQLQDVRPGAGWGVIDSLGRPKPIWHALRRIFQPRQVLLTDEGLNGLHIHVLNETPEPTHAVLRLVCLKNGTDVVRESSREITISGRSAVRYEAAALLGAFFDITYAYRFGPRVHDVNLVTLHDTSDNSLISQAVHFPGGPHLPPQDLGLQVRLERCGLAWHLAIKTRAFAQFLCVEDPQFDASDNWLHLLPGDERKILLSPRDDASAVPNGEIRALNMDRVVRFAWR